MFYSVLDTTFVCVCGGGRIKDDQNALFYIFIFCFIKIGMVNIIVHLIGPRNTMETRLFKMVLAEVKRHT